MYFCSVYLYHITVASGNDVVIITIFVYLDKANDPKDINVPQSCKITGEKSTDE